MFLFLESMDETPPNKLSPFLIEKVTSSRANPKYVRKIRSRKLLVEVNEKKKTYWQPLKIHNYISKAWEIKLLQESDKKPGTELNNKGGNKNGITKAGTHGSQN